MNKQFEKLIPYCQKLHALQSGLILLNWDNSTYGAPKAAIAYTAQDMGVLQGEIFGIINSPEVREIVLSLSGEEGSSDLNPSQKAIVAEFRRNIKKLERIPREEYQEYAELIANAYPIWENAKLNNDFESYAPTLKKIIDYNKKFCGYRQEPGQSLYDVALDDFEPGFTEEMLSDFFGRLKDRVLPRVKEIADRNEAEPAFLTIPVKKKYQKGLSRYIAEYIGFDFEKGVLAETEHPFTTNLHNHDVRITTHYYKNHWTYALFSTIHEGGHALYEQGISDDITMTPIGAGASMGLHESQSRFYENYLGRGKAFWEPIYNKVADNYIPFLSDIDLEDFYKGINFAKPTLIRTEADELTYPFHIVIRYELEKAIFENDINVNDLPDMWNQKYKEYLHIDVPDNTTGILQDMHWSAGNFGYFPTYAIGTAIAAQIYRYMQKDIDIDSLLRAGNMSRIRDYLRENIHQYGNMYDSMTILNRMTGEGFNPDYYIDYLLEKFK